MREGTILLLVLIPLALACTQHLEDSVNPILVSVMSHGGLCPIGVECKREFTVYRSGTYISSEKNGTLSPDELKELVRQITNADFASVESKKFTGTCPTAFDGNELVFIFYAQTKHIIPSCTYVVDMEASPFKLISKLIG